MKHDPIRIDAALAHATAAEIAPLRLSARRTTAFALGAAAAAIVVVSALGVSVFGALVLKADVSDALLLGLSALVVGAVASTFAVSLLAHEAGRIIAMPVETVVEYLAATGDGVPSNLNWRQGAIMRPAAIEHDLKVLDRRMHSVARRSRATIADLELAREQANEQNLAKSQFLANMSHELRTPLNAILGYAMLLQEDAGEAGNKDAVADLDRIQHAGRSLLSLINAILDLSRIEAGKTIIEREVIDVHALIDGVVSNHCAEDQRNGNAFALDVATETGMIVGDGEKIRQCLANLLDNAFKYTQSGKVSLTVERTSDNALPVVRFSVRDTGIGIDDADLGELFQAFEQVDATATRKYGGSGLGLAITRRLARMMGGDCRVESVKGEGSVFHLILPQSPQNVAANDQIDKKDAFAIVKGAKSQPKRVLVIDDDPDALDLLCRWLSNMGLAALPTSSGEAGLQLAREHKPDIILLDALLPDRSGYDILTDLRSDDGTANIPVVLITVDDDRRRGIEAGASDYIRKPVSKEQLRSVMEIYCGKASGEILLIEDDDDAAELIRRSVEEAGFVTRRASNGVEGLAMAGKARPSAIILDLVMPELDGFGVIERLKADETLSDVPLIVLSSREITPSEHATLMTAGYRFFTKGASTPRQIAQSLKEMVA